MPIREIARRTGLSRNTVRKYLANQVVEPRYPKRNSPSQLDDYEPTLRSWLHREAKRHRKQRRNTRQLHRDLMQLGYTGSYDRVAAFARHWRQEQQTAQGGAGKHSYVPLAFAPGEAFQFDWSEEWAALNGDSTKLQAAHVKLCYSRAFMLRAYFLQSHEMLFDAHYHALAALGGVPERGIYDHMKTAVDKVGRGKERQVNKRFQAMVSHYLFEAEFCNPAAGWEKGRVEKGVRDARHRVWQDAPSCESLDELNDWLTRHCQRLWQTLKHPEEKHRTIAEVWREEQACLMPLPVAFDGFVEYPKRVSSTCLVSFEQNRYSVPAGFANRVVSLRVYAGKLVIVAEGHPVAEHHRVFTRDHSVTGKTCYDWRHYLAVVQRKPGALRNGAPFTELPPSFRRLQSKLLTRPGGDREMVDILALVLLYDEHQVEQAVTAALAAGQPSKQQVLNCLHRLQDRPQHEPLLPPPALRLATEPLADTARYDDLRETRHAQ
jgi:transposase